MSDNLTKETEMQSSLQGGSKQNANLEQKKNLNNKNAPQGQNNSKKSSAEVNLNSKDNEQDVPDDFFDDFLKDDFMAGLDIVDEDDEALDQIESNTSQTKRDISTKESNNAPKSQKNSSEKAPVKKETKSFAQDKQPKRVDANLNSKVKKPDRPKSGIDANRFDIRRDPEKTRQAIQKDKIRTVKHKEKKLITDIVETGLVPPGMELEVDIEEVCNISKLDENSKLEDLRQKLQSRRSDSKNFDNTRKRRINSPNSRTDSKLSYSTQSSRQSFISDDEKRQKRASSRSPITYRKPPYKNNYFNRNIQHQNHTSPHRRSPRRSPFTRRTRSPVSRRTRSPVSRKRSRTPNQQRRSRTPNQQRRSRSRNRSSTFRNRNDRSSSRERSRKRSRTPNKYDRREGKMTFLEELAVKLNETHNHPVMHYNVPAVMYPNVASFPAPVPPPAPHSYFPHTAVPQYDPYDQSFFIGNTGTQTTADPYLNQANPAGAGNGEDCSKPFEDQRIKLSDFLASTAKPQVNSSTAQNLQEKIKVIQRCQEAIKILNEKKFVGPLVVYKTDTYQSSEDRTLSPLLRKPVVQLPFTTPGLKNSDDKNFTKSCEALLHRLRVETEFSSTQDTRNPQQIPDVPPPPKIDQLIPTTRSFSIQTDQELSACKECLRRKGVQYSNCGVQAGDPTLTFSVSTQVTEADFYSMIPITQSLASLTPAQLLGKQSMINDVYGARSMPVSRGVPSPPAAPSFFYPQQRSALQDNSQYREDIASLMNTTFTPPAQLQNRTNFNARWGGQNKRY